MEVVPPALFVFTVMDSAATNDTADSDVAIVSGLTDPVAVASGATNLTLDAGLYVPALLNGYVFKDRDGDALRSTGDGTLTNVLVRLMVNGQTIDSALTGTGGYYSFENVPAGTVSILVSRVSSTLTAVPTEGDAATDPRRNRAVEAAEEEALIVFNVTSGYGVLPDQPAETLNFGFLSYPLSTALDIALHATANGVMIELWTVNESGNDAILILAWINNAWVEIGRVPSWQVVGEDSNHYSVQATGLAADGAYLIKIIDEAGHVHVSSAPVAVKAIHLDAVRLDMETLTLSFNTEYGRRYVVKVSTNLIAWSTEYVSSLKATGWTAYANTPFAASPGAKTQALVPLNGRKQAFFKIARVDE